MTEEQQQLLQMLKERFEKNRVRHENISWDTVEQALVNDAQKLESVWQLEQSGGEPDVVELELGVASFVDCVAETPKGRRSVCYDQAALASRKQHKPAASVQGLAAEWGVQLLTEDQYRKLQTFGEFDKKTSSWVQTPEAIRKLGGALFCDRRYDTVFVYHNGADSYYSSRSFRAYVSL